MGEIHTKYIYLGISDAFVYNKCKIISYVASLRQRTQKSACLTHTRRYSVYLP